MLKTLDDLPYRNQRVLVRVDFNVPLRDGDVTDDTRIQKALPTLRELAAGGATLILVSHLGRPKGTADPQLSLAPVAKRLSELLNKPVRFEGTPGPASAAQEAFVAAAEPGSLTLVENTRFDARETKNDPELAKVLAGYADVYVNDAFGAAHRAHASTEGVARLLPSAAGRLMQRELEVLSQLTHAPEKPFNVIIGGAKVSDKIGVIENLLDQVDALFIGGAMAYTFVRARGGDVADSLVEEDRVEMAGDLMQRAEAKGIALHLPEDSVCAREIAPGADTAVHPSGQIPAGMKGLDAGPAALAAWTEQLSTAKTVFWNGPLGVFEVPPFDAGTRTIARAVAGLNGFTVVGGGDSVAAVNAAGLSDRIGHVSTGGGASLEFLEGATLPGVAVLEKA